MTTLTSLPTEILCRIAEHVDCRDLMKMRLVCKSLHSTANKPFGITYFTIRHHVLSMESIEALLEIVSHAGLGSYVCSIALTAMFPVPLGPHSPYLQYWEVVDESRRDAFVNSREYMRLMKQVFNKLSRLQKSVHISICDPESQYGFGWDELMGHPSLRIGRCHVETLDQTLIAAIRANCHIRSLELNMYHYSFETLHDALEDLLNPTRLPLKLTIHCTHKQNRRLHSPYTIIYDQADKSLKLNGCDVYELDRAKEGTSIKLLFAFLLSQTTKLILEDCHLCSDQRFRAFLALGAEALHNNLTSIRMQNFRPCRTRADARRHWYGILKSLSELVGLEHFVIEELRGPSHWVLFHLPCSTEKYEVSGDGVAEQLEAFASLVATVPTHQDQVTSTDAFYDGPAEPFFDGPMDGLGDTFV